MIVERNKELSKVSWLSTSYSGIGKVENFYLPESLNEYVEVVRELQTTSQNFIVVGHTSNIYFHPDYICNHMISTKLLNKYEVIDDILICDCGVKVSTLAKDMVGKGYCGFEGLVDLPGTIGGGLYGNAGCYDCLVSDNLIKVDIVSEKGDLITLTKNDMKYAKRSSILKRGELKATIVCAYFGLIKGDVKTLQEKASKNHSIRKATQPGPAHNLGSIYDIEEPTIMYYALRVASRIYGMFIFGKSTKEKETKRKNFELFLMGGTSLIPYVDSWNRFIWKDSNAHKLFWRYNKIHNILFKNSHFEIEILS